MKPLVSMFRLTLLAALFATTALNTRPAVQVHALGTSITVNTFEDSIPPDTSDGKCSLREAITNANDDTVPPTYGNCAAGTGNDSIFFAGTGTIVLAAQLPTITDPDGLTVDGDRKVTIHGNYLNRLFSIQVAALTLKNLKLFGGYTDVNSTGGSVVYNNSGTLIVANSEFYFNQGLNGAAIYNGNGTLTVANSLFLENTAYATGGAVHINGGTATMSNNTFSKNLAGVNGGDLYVQSGTVYLMNNIFANGLGGGNCGYSVGTVAGKNNLFEDGSSACGFVHAVNGNLVGFNPLFVPDPNNPNSVVLSSSSPAIDAGDAAACGQPPVDNTSHNGLPRPQGIRCDIGAYEYPQTLVQARFLSSASEDGHILESTETSGVGGTKNNIAANLYIGDNAANKQYRAILSFDTSALSSLPDDAIITSVTLWFKDAGKSGTLPFLTHGKLLVDVKTVNFGSTAALELADFKATASKSAALSFTKTNLDPSGWYSQAFLPGDFVYINREGMTQFRLRFTKDDNNDFGADYLKIVSGDGDPYLVPQLLIDYYDR
jgi:CSLREA domain-containing protein